MALPFAGAVAVARGILSGIPRQVWYALAIGVAVWWAYDWAYDRGAASRDAEVAKLQGRIADLAEDVRVASEANESNATTIAELKQANNRWAETLRVNEEEAAARQAALEQERARLAGELAASRQARAKIYQGDTYAASWAAAAVPVGIYRSLLSDEAARPD